MSSRQSLNIKDPDEIKPPPAKRPKNEDDENCTDPIQLPEPCANKIMQYLTVKDLLNAMLVSKAWRDFIKVRGSLMDKLLFNPNAGDEQLVPTEENKRNYKHIKGPLLMRAVINPISFYASTLETLKLVPEDDAYKYFNVPACIYPKLQKLTCDVKYLSRLEGSSFPALTYLKVAEKQDFSNTSDLFSTDAIDQVLRSTPSLEVLDLNLNVFKRDRSEINADLNCANIKAIYSHYFIPNFMKSFASTLERIDINQMNKAEIDELLNDFKALKSLTIVTATLSTNENAALFTRNDSIEILKIFDISAGDSIVGPHLKKLLMALPSLKELVLLEDAINKDILQFLGKILIY